MTVWRLLLAGLVGGTIGLWAAIGLTVLADVWLDRPSTTMFAIVAGAVLGLVGFEGGAFAAAWCWTRAEQGRVEALRAKALGLRVVPDEREEPQS